MFLVRIRFDSIRFDSSLRRNNIAHAAAPAAAAAAAAAASDIVRHPHPTKHQVAENQTLDTASRDDTVNNRDVGVVVKTDNNATTPAGGTGRGKKKTKKTTKRRRNRFVLYSDFTCPYCYLEFVRLTRAMERLPEPMRLDISHGVFQLDGSLPMDGVDKYGYLTKLIPPSVLDPMIEILRGQFEDLDLPEMNPRGLLGNSGPAHWLQIWAEETRPRAEALALKDELFRIHSCHGKSVGDVGAIAAAAAAAGLTAADDDDDGATVRAVLKDPRYAYRFRKSRKHARDTLGITSVPCLVLIDGKTGTERILEEATGIETVDGFADLIAEHF